MSAWTFASIPDLSGRVAIVTGANTGIGFETARMLAAKGAEVVLACRNEERATTAVARIRTAHPHASVRPGLLDLSDLGSVRSFAENFAAAEARLDMLVLNAGIMVPPYGRTKDGFELQFGTNHLGHFALAARLFPLVRATRDARVVTVTSVAQRAGTVEFADLHWERRAYKPWGAYGQSKLANMLFGAELGRRIDAANARGATITARSTLAQPGWTSTDFQRTTWLVRMLNPLFGMSPPEGALSTLRAACDPNAAQGSYWGPGGWMEARGAPQPARVAPRIADRAVAERLWSVSEELVGTSIDLAPSLGAPVHKAA